MRSIQAQVMAAVLATVAGHSWAHGGDVGIAVGGGQLLTGRVDASGPDEVVIPGERVFAGELTFGGGVGDEPGFFAEAGTLPGGSLLGFTIKGALRKWDPFLANGNGIAAETLTIESPSGTESVTTPAGDTSVDGWSFVFPGSGNFDDHPNYYVNNRTGGGVYILQLQLTTNAPGIAGSQSLWMVINDEFDDEQHDLAIDWVKENVAPAPGASAVLLGGLAMGIRRRR